jgi:hypothetical protein
MTQTALLTSISTYLDGISGLPDIFYPNRNNTTIPDDYLEVLILGARPDDIGLSSVTMNSGIIQINVCTKENIGVIHSSDIVDAVIAAFARGTVIDSIRIDKTPYASQGIPIDAKFKVPVTITYNYMTV